MLSYVVRSMVYWGNRNMKVQQGSTNTASIYIAIIPQKLMLYI